jgi:hypothetical protein
MKFHALGGPAMGCPYDAVGMQRALDSAIGLPSRSNQRVVDARVLDASGREKKLHATSVESLLQA